MFSNKSKHPILIAILFFIAVSIVSFAFTAGIYKLISLCFGIPFSFKIAAGVWLVLLLLNGVKIKIDTH